MALTWYLPSELPPGSDLGGVKVPDFPLVFDPQTGDCLIYTGSVNGLAEISPLRYHLRSQNSAWQMEVLDSKHVAPRLLAELSFPKVRQPDSVAVLIPLDPANGAPPPRQLAQDALREWLRKSELDVLFIRDWQALSNQKKPDLPANQATNQAANQATNQAPKIEFTYIAPLWRTFGGLLMMLCITLYAVHQARINTTGGVFRGIHFSAAQSNAFTWLVAVSSLCFGVYFLLLLLKSWHGPSIIVLDGQRLTLPVSAVSHSMKSIPLHMIQSVRLKTRDQKGRYQYEWMDIESGMGHFRLSAAFFENEGQYQRFKSALDEQLTYAIALRKNARK
jgi:hypothetical protein